MSDVQDIETLASKLDINKEGGNSKEAAATTTPSSKDKASAPEVTKETTEGIESQKKPQSPSENDNGTAHQQDDEARQKEIEDLRRIIYNDPPKPPRLSETFKGPVELVIRSPTSPKSRSASGGNFQRSISSASLDSAVLSDDSSTTEGGPGNSEEERHRLSRGSIGSYNPLTEENMTPEPLPTHDDEGNPIEYTERRIPIGYAPADHMVALGDRPKEMVRLMELHKDITNRIKFRLGVELWPKAKKLWTETPRSQMKDKEWLRKSHYILVTMLNGEKRFWSEWKLMVGWNPTDCESLFKEEPERPVSAGSSLQLDRIEEGDD